MVQTPFHSWHEHFAIELNGARAVFTTRRGGYSSGPYAALNLGRLTEDDRQAVERNRALLSEQVGRPLAFVRQVHGAEVRPARAFSAAEDPEEADGLIAHAGLAPLVTTADCLPIALASGDAVVMLHAGWRGLAAGVIEQGVQALRGEAGGAPIAAAIGPGAGPCCYEVDDEVHRQFAAYGPAARRGRALDLKAIARQQLAGADVEEVHDIGLCTICGPELFFSHRRDQGVTGRQAGVIWLS